MSWRRKDTTIRPDRLGGHRPSREVQQIPSYAMLASQGGVKPPQPNHGVSSNQNDPISSNGNAGQIPTVALRELGADDTNARDRPFNISIGVGEEAANTTAVEATTDSGACVNAMDHQFWLINKDTIGALGPPDFNISVADGRKIGPAGAVTCKVILPHDKGTFETTVRFQVIETTDEWQILLGKPWLRQIKAIVDYNSETLTIKGDEMDRTWRNIAQAFQIEGDGHVRSLRAGQTEEDASYMTAQPELPDPVNEDRSTYIMRSVTIGEDLTAEQKQTVSALVKSYEDIFALDLADIDPCPHTVHTLNIDPEYRFSQRAFGRPLSRPELEAAEEQTKMLLKAGIVEGTRPEDVKCCSPTVMAIKRPKPSKLDIEALKELARKALDQEEGLGTTVEPHDELEKLELKGQTKEKVKYRLCHNFGQLNRATQVLPYPPGDLDSKVLKHSGKRWICQFDALGAFYWIRVADVAKPYLCYHLPGMGYFRYARLPMGPTGSPGTYQRAMRITHGNVLDPGPVSDWMDDLFTSATPSTSSCRS